MQATEKDKAQASLDALTDAPEPGTVLRDLDGVTHGVVTCSVREEPLELLVTYKRRGSRVLLTQPLNPLALCGEAGTAWEDWDARVRRAWDALADAPKRGQVFRHYKGGLYSVVTASLEMWTLTPLVTYISNLKGTAWTRTLENFLEDVCVIGDWRPRFMREDD